MTPKLLSIWIKDNYNLIPLGADKIFFKRICSHFQSLHENNVIVIYQALSLKFRGLHTGIHRQSS